MAEIEHEDAPVGAPQDRPSQRIGRARASRRDLERSRVPLTVPASRIADGAPRAPCTPETRQIAVQGSLGSAGTHGPNTGVVFSRLAADEAELRRPVVPGEQRTPCPAARRPRGAPCPAAGRIAVDRAAASRLGSRGVGQPAGPGEQRTTTSVLPMTPPCAMPSSRSSSGSAAAGGGRSTARAIGAAPAHHHVGPCAPLCTPGEHGERRAEAKQEPERRRARGVQRRWPPRTSDRAGSCRAGLPRV